MMDVNIFKERLDQEIVDAKDSMDNVWDDSEAFQYFRGYDAGLRYARARLEAWSIEYACKY